MRNSLNTLSISITGETFVAVLRTEMKLDNIALGVYATKQAVMGMAATQQGIALTQQNMAAQISGIGAKKTVQERRDSENNKLAVEYSDLTFHEPSPFANGSFGGEKVLGWKRHCRFHYSNLIHLFVPADIYRVMYEDEVVVAKMINLKDVKPQALEATKKEYKREVSLMAGLRSQFCVSILGAVTKSPTELIILMEYCVGGDLR